MRDVPIEVIAHFPFPNYTNPKTRGPALLYTNVILIGITVAFVALRVYTRVFIKRWMGADDWFILIATFFTIGLTTCVVLANKKYYWDRHIWDVPFTKIESLAQIALAAKLFFSIATFFTRLSLLSFYYRLLHDTTLKAYRLVLHASSIFSAMVFILFIFLTIFQCSPISAYWIYPSTGNCLSEGHLTLACGIINCFLDLLITTLPIPMVMRLKMHRRQRIGVVVLLSLGFVVTIAGIVRTVYICKSLLSSYDETWYAYPLWIAAAVEVDLAVICACAPAIRPFLLMYFRPLVASLSGSRSTRSHNKGKGYVSTSSGPSKRNFSSEEVTFDEKIGAIDVIREDGKTPRVKLSLTKPPHGGRLEIMQRVSWEVDFGDHPEPKLSNDPDSHENHHAVVVAVSSSSDEEWHSRAGRNQPPRVDVTEDTRRYTMEPNSPCACSETDSTRSGSNRRTQTATARERETFWRSDSEGSTTSDHPPEGQDGERRWDILRNPFRDDQQVSPTLPTSRTYEGARAIELKAFVRSKSPPMRTR